MYVSGDHAEHWASVELAPWRHKGLTHEVVSEAIDTAVAQHGAMFRYDVQAGEVICRSKTSTEMGPGVGDAITTMLEGRARAYRDLLQASLPFSRIRRDFTLGIDVSDLPSACPGLPFFAFQKRRGEGSLLLPDVDLLEFEYLEPRTWVDRTRHHQKRHQAIFVGSTTGEMLTLAKVKSVATPRLRAACAFKGSPHVVFQLPNIVQCDSEETEAALKALELGRVFVPWPEQMRYRHLISIDGNGATCSRVAIALHGHSTLLKYESDYELFYFKGLEPWVHFVPITRDADVETVVADGTRDPARYARLAREGRRFFRAHLSRRACRRYVAALLRGYVAMLDGEAYAGPPVRGRARRQPAGSPRT